ncbi:MAG TPA: HdeD family acid-resistance protein [Streptosporangiaceae bacterium]|jgi:uncharacterized membrane protein HdeD (DUF308 family)
MSEPRSTHSGAGSDDGAAGSAGASAGRASSESSAGTAGTGTEAGGASTSSVAMQARPGTRRVSVPGQFDHRPREGEPAEADTTADERTGPPEGMMGALGTAARRSWMALLIGGLGMIALGIMLLVWPHVSFTIVAILIGAALVVSGVVRLIEGFTAHQQGAGMRAAYVVLGLLAVIAGIYCLKHHALSLLLLAFLVGVYFITHGISDIGVAASVRAPGRGLRATIGVFAIAAGLVTILWPAITLILLLSIVGAWLIFYGLLLAGLAFTVHRAGRELTGRAARSQPAT